MITTPSKDQNTENAVDNQDAEQVASIKLDDVTGGWGWYGPGPGPGAYARYWGGPGGFYGGPARYYGGPGPGNPYYAAAMERRAAAYYGYPGW